MGGDNVVIEPLEVENYGTWHLRMKALLTHKGLWKAVEGSGASGSGTSVTASTEGSGRPAAGTSEDSDKALSLIILNVKDQHLTTLATCKTAKEAWEKLATTYQSQLNARRMQLRKQLTLLKMASNKPLTVYFARARTLWTDLKVAGHTMAESEVVYSTLSGLPSQYNTAVEIITTTTKEELKLDTVLAQLLPVEARHSRDTEGSSAEVGTPALVAHSDSHSCFYCGKAGHLIKHCYQRKRDMAKQAHAQPVIVL
jgi:hypothetical protein